jgi:hypothetical protein
MGGLDGTNVDLRDSSSCRHRGRSRSSQSATSQSWARHCRHSCARHLIQLNQSRRCQILFNIERIPLHLGSTQLRFRPIECPYVRDLLGWDRNRRSNFIDGQPRHLFRFEQLSIASWRLHGALLSYGAFNRGDADCGRPFWRVLSDVQSSRAAGLTSLGGAN